MEKNIQLAVEQERKYLHRKVDCGDNTANIYEYLAPSGYSDLSEFHRDKQEYLLRDEYYYVVEEPYIGEEVPIPFINDRKCAFLYTIKCDTNYAFVGNDFDNDAYLESCGFEVLRLSFGNKQGLILSSNGDLRVYLIIKDGIGFGSGYFLHKMRNFLSTKFPNVSVDGNDLLIDNKKVCGTVDFVANDMRVILFQITFVDNVELIKRICGERVKEPGYIDSNVITADELKNEMLVWLIGR